MTKQEWETTTIDSKIIEYIEDDEADWRYTEERIKAGDTFGSLFRYRTAISVGEWRLKTKREDD